MEVLEFIKQKDRMCVYYSGRTCTHDDSGETCPAMSIDCEITTDEPEQLVAVVEQWAKAHPEEAADATKPKQDEPCVKTMQDDLSGAIYQTIKNCEDRFAERKSVEGLEEDCYKNFQIIENRHIETCKEIVRLKDRVAELEVALKAQPVPAPKPKQTRKDMLLAAFPDAYVYPGGVPLACPLSLDKHHECSKSKNCEECITTYWTAEVEE